MKDVTTFLANPFVTLVAILIIGGVIGWVYEEQTHSPHGYRTSALVGIAGSFIGFHLAGLVAIPQYPLIVSLIAAAVGALVILWAWRTFRDKRKSRRRR